MYITNKKKIVEFLLLNGQTPCKTISQALSVSDKTIRNEIHKINCIDNEPLIYSDQSGFFIAQNKIKDSLQLLKKSTSKYRYGIIATFIIEK